MAWVMLPMGQKLHHVLGLNKNMVAKPKMVDVNITLKNPKDNWAIQGDTKEVSAHVQGNLKVHSRVIASCSGLPAKT